MSWLVKPLNKIPGNDNVIIRTRNGKIAITITVMIYFFFFSLSAVTKLAANFFKAAAT